MNKKKNESEYSRTFSATSRVGWRQTQGTGSGNSQSRAEGPGDGEAGGDAPPGETFVGGVHGETGLSPRLNALFDEIPFLGLVVAMTRRF